MNHLIFALFCIIFGWGSVAFGQNNNSETLVISTEGLTHNRISIKDIFLSSNGLDTGGSASIQLLGEIGTVKSKVLEATTSAKVQGLILQDRGCSTKDPNKKCILATDASGKVHVVTNFDEIYTVGGSNGGVFQRGTDHTDAYFADQQGNLAPVGKTQQILRVGVNSDNRRGSLKDDAALLVGGSVETRGGVLIKKIDNLLANTGSNKDLDINSRPYTSLDTTVNNGNINFQSFKKDERQDYPTQFLFTNKSATHPTKVGINTSNPSSALTVGRGGDITLVADSNGNPNDAGDLIFKKANGSQNARIWSRNDGAGGLYMASANNTPQITLQHDGKVGIGSNIHHNLQAKLHIDNITNGQATTLDAIRISGNNSPTGFASKQDIRWNFLDAGSSVIRAYRGGSWDTYLQFLTNDRGANRDNPQVRMHISDDGKIGIGTTTPSEKLHVRGNIKSFGDIISDGGFINIIRHSNWGGGYARGLNLINANGTVEAGIGFYGSASAPHTIYMGYGSSPWGGNNNGMSIRNNGNIGIGLHNPSEKLHVNGNVRANAYFYNSDKRYKTDIKPLNSMLEKITRLGGYSYFNTLKQTNDIGLIAQEVEQTFPEIVATDAQGYKTVAYANLVAPIIEAIKELNTTVQQLFDQYISQQAQIDALEARIQALEQK